jgi:CRISPR-associated protein Cas5d
VSYLIDARFTMRVGEDGADHAARHAGMFKRRARAQRFFQAPNLGGPDWPAQLRLLHEGEVATSCYAGTGALDLGWMVFDRDPDDRTRLEFFRPSMIDGVIDVAAVERQALPS